VRDNTLCPTQKQQQLPLLSSIAMPTMGCSPSSCSSSCSLFLFTSDSWQSLSNDHLTHTHYQKRQEEEESDERREEEEGFLFLHPFLFSSSSSCLGI
jgi:tRNA(Phe) wybutosine-synthesizing methylase Tyw3